jgi:DNA processing protein
VTLEELTDLFILGSINQFGPQKFKELHSTGVKPRDVLSNADLLPMKGKRASSFAAEIRKITPEIREICERRAIKQMVAAEKHQARILTYDSPYYPRNVYESNSPTPVLYVRGDFAVLLERKIVGCVGSRKIRPPYSFLQADFAREATEQGFVVVSGFALGADSIGHESAITNNGRTICVMPSGLERPFPPENKQLWEQFLVSNRAVFVSEFGFGVRAASLTLRKRNRLIVALARGVLIGQSASKGGAMNAYRFAREQHKPVATFASDHNEDTSGNKLISEEHHERDRVFPISVNKTSYTQWLHQLSSSI